MAKGWHKSKYLVLAFRQDAISYRTTNDFEEAKVLAKELSGMVIKAPIHFHENLLAKSNPRSK